MITYNFKEDTDMSEIKQPASALSSPRFCNMGTFMRMQKVDTAEGLVSRSGCRISVSIRFPDRCLRNYFQE